MISETENLTEVKNTRPLMILVDKAYLELKTRIARHYFFNANSEQDKEHIGLLNFVRKVREIWAAAKLDDPYADLYLLKIYDGLISLRREIQSQTKHYQEIIQKQVSFNWKLGLSDAPKKIILNFRHPYGFMAANLIASFDEYACVLYSAKMLGVILDKSIDELLNKIGEKISILFALSHKWESTGISREDINNKTEKFFKVKNILDSLGVINDQILSSTLRSPHAPKIINSTVLPSIP